jgi:uncharacterized protein YbjT (DUF2867 family)
MRRARGYGGPPCRCRATCACVRDRCRPCVRLVVCHNRGQGERAVRAANPGAVLVRPAVMFGPDDAFLTVILQLVRRLPAYPMFGSGTTRLQPAHVEDVAEAIVRLLQRTDRDPRTLECGGPQVYTYRELVRSIAGGAGREPILCPVPFAVWYALARPTLT